MNQSPRTKEMSEIDSHSVHAPNYICHLTLYHSIKVCLGLRWLRGNDNDSIGREDDRRGAMGTGPQQLDMGQPFGRHSSRRPRIAQQRPAAALTTHQLVARAPEAMDIKCCHADVVTHLGHTRKPLIGKSKVENV